MKILGIETSCDETATAVAEGSGEQVQILANVVSSQVDIHKKYGGVVPEVAAREHVLNILPVLHEALKKAGIEKPQKEIGAIAVASGPGLITSLQVGVETAKALAFVWGLPLLKINHIEAHIYANFIREKNKYLNTYLNTYFPALILTVSGGHTMLVLMHEHGRFEIIGETRDDAVGEAFDKAAKLMGLGYPGGPIVAKMAEEYSQNRKEERGAINKLPRPMMNSQNFDFSFSGLKTALRYALEKDKNWQKKIPGYCFEFQSAAVEVLTNKTIKAARKYGVKNIMLAGGVAANLVLREKLQKEIITKLPGLIFIKPELKYTTDNAAMVASAGYFRAEQKDYIHWQDLRADCNFELEKRK